MSDPGLQPYFDPYFSCEAVRVLPGGYLAVATPLLLVTLLGSCVAVCLRDRRSGVAGMNHFMLPDSRPDDDKLLPARYGLQAMELLINDMLKLGAARNAMEAKVFGGGNVLGGGDGRGGVGQRNIEFIRGFLECERIPVVACDLGSDTARRIYFFADSGRVLLKKLPRSQVDAVLADEGRYRKRLNRAAHRGGGDVDLFL